MSQTHKHLSMAIANLYGKSWTEEMLEAIEIKDSAVQALLDLEAGEPTQWQVLRFYKQARNEPCRLCGLAYPNRALDGHVMVLRWPDPEPLIRKVFTCSDQDFCRFRRAVRT